MGSGLPCSICAPPPPHAPSPEPEAPPLFQVVNAFLPPQQNPFFAHLSAQLVHHCHGTQAQKAAACRGLLALCRSAPQLWLVRCEVALLSALLHVAKEGPHMWGPTDDCQTCLEQLVTKCHGQSLGDSAADEQALHSCLRCVYVCVYVCMFVVLLCSCLLRFSSCVCMCGCVSNHCADTRFRMLLL